MSKNELDFVKAYLPGVPRPGFIRALNPHGDHGHSHFARQNGGSLFELLQHSVERAPSFRENAENAPLAEAASSDLHGPEQVGIRIDGNDVGEARKKLHQPVLKVLAVADKESPFEHAVRHCRHQNERIQIAQVIGANEIRPPFGKVFQTPYFQPEKNPAEKIDHPDAEVLDP